MVYATFLYGGVEGWTTKKKKQRRLKCGAAENIWKSYNVHRNYVSAL